VIHRLSPQESQEGGGKSRERVDPFLKEDPVCSDFSHTGDAPGSVSFLWPSTGLSAEDPCLFCTEESRTGYSTPGEA